MNKYIWVTIVCIALALYLVWLENNIKEVQKQWESVKEGRAVPCK